MNNPIELQQSYYSHSADHYDNAHLGSNSLNEHDFALSFLCGIIEHHKIKSILDIGSGTGRAVFFIKNRFPHLKVVGIEPVSALVEIARSKGLSEDEILIGDGAALPYNDCEFDLVTEFGVLHHVRQPKIIIDEMFRVSRVGIFISDSNNLGQGSLMVRKIKLLIFRMKLWSLFQFFITKGKYYHYSEGDGIFYSYSVFHNLKQIQRQSYRTHILNNLGGNYNHLTSSPHISLFALKNPL